ncbi:TPA: carbon storage regulator [Legionella pneumophila]|jgi:carbon storage regulator
MEIRTVTFESDLIIILEGNQKIVITPFKTPEPGNFKLGIEAPKHVTVNRQEIYLRKQEQLKKNKAKE